MGTWKQWTIDVNWTQLLKRVFDLITEKGHWAEGVRVSDLSLTYPFSIIPEERASSGSGVVKGNDQS